VAAPVFREVATAALRMLDVPKDLPDSLVTGTRSVSSVTQPPVQVGAFVSPASGGDAPRLSANLRIPGGLEVGPAKDGSSLDRRPFSDRPQTFTGVKVPDFRGMTLRAVLEESAARGLPVEVAGDGIAREQDPPPGSKLAPNGQVRVQFGR
jgi:cell division protein FtsI (penicillin-binding protein 3)